MLKSPPKDLEIWTLELKLHRIIDNLAAMQWYLASKIQRISGIEMGTTHRKSGGVIAAVRL